VGARSPYTTLGPLRRTDRPGGPPGLHDFEAHLADGSVAALEVTGEVDGQRLRLAAAAERRLSSITLSNSESLWLVGLAAGVRVGAIRPDDLRRLLGELEAGGRRNAHDIGDYRDRFVARLRALGIESVYAVKAKAGSQGTVLVRPGTYGGWGWDGAAIDRWLGEFLASHQGINKLGKLGRARAAQRHLAVVLDPFSPAGMGIPLGVTARQERGAADYALPSFVPPEPLSHLWLLPAFTVTQDALGWMRHGGWAVLEQQGVDGPVRPGSLIGASGDDLSLPPSLLVVRSETQHITPPPTVASDLPKRRCASRWRRDPW
jgi:hypothetical protein